MLEIKARDAAGRICSWKVAGCKITTPNIAVVVNPSKLAIKPREMKKFGAELLMTNAYIIKKSKESAEIEKKGLKKFLSWDGPVYTDSGTFQMYSKGGADIGPEETVEYQKLVGSDIVTPLDVFTLPSDTRQTAGQKLEETMKRTGAAREAVKKQMLVGPVQGGRFLDIRREAASRISGLSPDVIAVGGIVPLMESYNFSSLIDILVAVKESCRPDIPLHAFGAGHPMVFSLLAAAGADLFDSAAYALYARAGRYMTAEGTLMLAGLKEFPCPCPACLSTSPEKMTEEGLARHNLYSTLEEIRAVRNAIRDGALFSLAKKRAMSHPSLLKAYRILLSHTSFLEKRDPVTKPRALFLTGSDDRALPAVTRHKERMSMRYMPPRRHGVIVKSYSKHLLSTKKEHVCAVQEPFGVIPGELLNLYPLGRLVPSGSENAPAAVRKSIKEYMGVFGKRYKSVKKTALKKYKKAGSEDRLLQARSTLRYQFGAGAEKILSRKPSLEFSKSTGRLRRAYDKGALLGVFRASDGFFVPSIEGAARLCKAVTGYKVIVDDEAAPFVRQGRSVFSKFVVDASEDIRPYDEVLAVDRKGRLISCGRALLNAEEMKASRTGVAVVVRHSC